MNPYLLDETTLVDHSNVAREFKCPGNDKYISPPESSILKSAEVYLDHFQPSPTEL
jgi:hypothetical protein